MPSLPVPRWARAACAASIGAAFLVQVAAGLAVHSGTCDELGAHLPAGILHWKGGRATSGLANPPLGQLLVAAGPVLTGTADHPLRDDPRQLLPARLPVVLLGLLVLVATAQIAARFAGPRAGWAAATATALCPDLVAHSGLATLDVPVTAFATLAGLLAWRWAREGKGELLAGFAVAIGAACLVKSTALHLFAATVVGGAWLPGTARERVSRAAALLTAGAIAVVAGAWLAYGPGPATGVLPAEYVAGLGGKVGQGARGHFSYLLGHRSADGFSLYYVIALAVKTPLALLIAALLGLWRPMRRRLSGDASGFAAFVLLPALWLLVTMSLVHRVHIGVRHVLPAYPAALALAGAGAAALAAGRWWERVVLAALAAWAAAVAVRITPDHLAYFNELAGGPERGDAILIDSNLDWGQDEGRFRAWAMGRHVTVNPERPTDGLVAANVNALRGIFAPDDLRLRWLRRLSPERSFGHSLRVYRVSEGPLREAASVDSLAALDYAWWLVGVGRPEEALTVLGRIGGMGDDPLHAKEFWKVRAEALLASDDLAPAQDAAGRAGDVDLAEEIAWRRRTRRGAPAGVAESARAVRALARRGHSEEASRLGVSVFGRDPLAVTASAGPRWSEASRLKALGQEREALEVVGRALADDPANDDALWLYGELVVRRKLGLTEYPMPDVDWSRVAHAR